MQLSSSARDSMQLLHSPPRGALHRRRHQRAHSMTSNLVLDVVLVLGTGGAVGDATASDRSPHRGECGARSARALLASSARLVFLNTPPSLPPLNRLRVAPPCCCSACVCARACRRLRDAPTCARRPRPVPVDPDQSLVRRRRRAMGDGTHRYTD